MIPLIPLAIAVGGTLLLAALGAHALQAARAARAIRLRRIREEQETAGRAAAEGAAARSAAAERARQAAAAEAARRQAETDRRRASNPGHYITVQASRLALALAEATGHLGRRRSDAAALEVDLAAVPPAPSLARQLLPGVGVIFLMLAFALSAAQLIPSFRTLSSRPSALDVVLGLVVAAIEVGVALMLAYYLRPENGWKAIGAKVSAAVAVTFAILVVVAQVEWAPAHDTVPLGTQLSEWREELSQAQQDHSGQTVITADQQEISNLEDKLRRTTERDQGLALMVTLGSDLSAWPALVALQYAADARRRRRLGTHIAALRQEIGGLEQQQDILARQLTLETQTELERLGINPAIAAGSQRAPLAIGGGQGPAGSTDAPADPGPRPADPGPQPADPAAQPADPAPQPAAPAAQPADHAPQPASAAPHPPGPASQPPAPAPQPADSPQVPAGSARVPADPVQVTVTASDLFQPAPVDDDQRWTDPI